MKPIIDDAPLLEKALRDFEQHLKNGGMKENPIDSRMRGARQFAFFLFGKPASYNEQLKGRPLADEAQQK